VDRNKELDFPLLVTTSGVHQLQAYVLPGKGQRALAAGFTGRASDSFQVRVGRHPEARLPCSHCRALSSLSCPGSTQVAVTWTALHAATIRAWVGQEGAGSSAPLFTEEQNALLTVSAIEFRKSGQSGGASIALAFVCWLAMCGNLCRPLVPVTGFLDLRGRVRRVGGLRDKARLLKQTAQHGEGRDMLFVVPEDNYSELVSCDFRALSPDDPDLCEWASRHVKGAATMVDVMALTVPGGCELCSNSFQELLDPD
jgi:hypothetical protein